MSFFRNLLTPRLLMLVLILTATWVRLWQFPNIPPAFNYDESYNVVDALWLRDTNTFTPFLPANTGRHALFHYLAIPFLTILGATPFALRFLSVIIGILVIPLMYRWISTMFARQTNRHYLGLIAATGLAFSFWHIAISRSGFRASLLLLLYVLMAYLFWQGWNKQSVRYIIGAGIALGLGQYTYWLAAILPLQFGLFALVWTVLKLRDKETRRLGDRGITQSAKNNRQSPISIRKVWLWIGVMALTSFIVFIPLGRLYFDTPLVLQYVSQSSIADKIASDPNLTWSGQLLTSLRVYLDGSAALWQGQWNRVFTFDWLILIGFWIGLVLAIARWRRPAYLFLLTGLFVLWIPVLLNDIDFSDLRVPDMLPVHHAISNLRAAGILPLYYATVAVGLLRAAEWIGKKLSIRKPAFAGLATFLIVFGISGLLNTYTFFVRWPQEPFLYERYNGPELDLAQTLARESKDKDILIPFHLYSHPTLQMVWDDIFAEKDTPPPNQPSRPAILVTALDAPLSSYVWLSRSESGEGAAFLTQPLPAANLLNLSLEDAPQIYHFAAPYFITTQTNTIPDLTPLQPQLAAWPVPNPVSYVWDDEIRLAGYQVTPGQPESGQPVTLTLYWQNLTDQPLLRDVFIHAINSSGEGVSQVDNVMLTDGHYRRKGKISPTYHIIELSDQLPAGPYLIRLGLFNTRTGNRVPITGDNSQILGDEVKLGLFYIINKGQPSINPKIPTQAMLGEQIRISGYTLPDEYPLGDEETIISSQIYWQATEPVDEDYTIFVQVLDSSNQFITGFDTQPLQGNYPTSLWQPGETIIQGANLTLPAQLPPGSYRLVTGMYNLDTGQRLTAADKQGNPLADNIVTLSNVIIATDNITFEAP